MNNTGAMIRKLEEKDYTAAIELVNENWKSVYADFISPGVISDSGCRSRAEEILQEFSVHKWDEYIWEEDGEVLALLSFGNAEDEDKQGAFEVRRIYVLMEAQGRGIGKTLLRFAEKSAAEKGGNEIVLWAMKENLRAIGFYQKAGYRPEKEEYLGDKYRTFAVRMIKKLL